MITTLANHEKSRSNHTSRNTFRRRYADGEAWRLDSQTYAPTHDLLTHATTFVEHNTGYAWAACLSRKSATTMIEAAKALQSHIYQHKHRSVRYLWTDSDPTTLATSFTDFLAREGILLGVSPPYQHEKNDKVERIHKPLRRLVTVLLHAGRLPIQMWAKAHAMALYIINITPRGGTVKKPSPLHAWTGIKPNICSLRMFGNPISALFQQRQRTDGELRGYPSIYLGPSDMAPQGHTITSRNGKGCVTSNDIVHGEHFQWVTHNNGEFTPTNRPPQTCRYDYEIAKIERDNCQHMRTIFRDWAYLNEGPIRPRNTENTTR
jgi:hypothetical protein